ncbi:DMT family transporter [Streptomyces sp. RPT161]|uniref:DMT family transporter n=1 Tax=Streptomyces sp. RPT161 TaxID=3015993 RepID=UPI0022B8DD15|nr:DMT family transporter [Streptomyces sp. RPT161]
MRESPPDDACAVWEGARVRTGVVEPEVGAGRFGGEPTHYGVSIAQHAPAGTPIHWAACAYLGVVSMFLSVFAWYRGLAIGPMAQVSQIQLVQPVMSICWAALFLREGITLPTILGGFTVIASAGIAVRTLLGRTRALTKRHRSLARRS